MAAPTAHTMAPPPTRKGAAVEDIPQAVIVSVNQTWPAVLNGTDTPEEASRKEWVIAEHRVSSIELLIAVFRGHAVGVFRITGHQSESIVSTGKTRPMNRVTFDVEPAPEWKHLLGVEFTNRQTPELRPLAELTPAPVAGR